MSRDFLMNKWFLGGVGFLIVFTVACVFWYQHDTAADRKAADDAVEVAREWGLSQKSDTGSEAEQADDVPMENNPLTAEKPTITETTIMTKDTAPTQAQAETKSPAETAETGTDVRVSPFGFGPYPKVPEDFISHHGRPVWENPGNLPESSQRNIELLHRVMIKKWNEGDIRFTSGTIENGMVYLNYPNTIYVRFRERRLPDGTLTRFISSGSSEKLSPEVEEQILQGKIPDGVHLIDLASPNAGTDPHTFLGLD